MLLKHDKIPGRETKNNLRSVFSKIGENNPLKEICMFERKKFSREFPFPFIFKKKKKKKNSINYNFNKERKMIPKNYLFR